VFVGASRGGLLTLLLAAAQPMSIAGVIFNDIGPAIEPKGLMRLKGYVGKIPQPRNEEEGAEILRRLFGHQFPSLDEAAWHAFARRTWRIEGDRFVPTADPKLAETLKSIDPEVPVPTLWPQFDALAHVPLMVVHGENSDILLPETVAAMEARRPDLHVMEVPGQGHTPLLAEPDTIAKLIAFIDICGTARR
jgi:pimeloyl-ACP methyl ester carboxylesterase